MADPDSPRVAVFLARDNAHTALDIPDGAHVVSRAEGTLVTMAKPLADWFSVQPKITDGDLARILGYPQNKADVLLSPDVSVVQVFDADGNVVYETGFTKDHLDEAFAAAMSHKPEGGTVDFCSTEDALKRRIGRACNGRI